MRKPLEFHEARKRVVEDSMNDLRIRSENPRMSFSHDPFMDLMPNEVKAASFMAKTQCDCLLTYLSENNITFNSVNEHGIGIWNVPAIIAEKYRSKNTIQQGQLYNDFMCQMGQPYYYHGSESANRDD